MWFIDIFGQPIINLLLGITGLLICFLAFIISVLCGSSIFELSRLALFKMGLVDEPYWRRAKRELRQLKEE